MLNIENLSKSYGNLGVLNGIDLSFERGEIRSFLGPNGAGKTTTFNIISGVEPPSGGSIHLDEENLVDLPIHMRARKGITYLPQETSLFRGLSVLDNIKVYGARIDGREDSQMSPISSLKRLNIEELKGRDVTKLSAGQKRKVEIARALVLSPAYLLLDEPFSDLDPRSVAGIKDILTSLKKEEQIGIALSDHRAEEALSISDYNYLLKDGIIIAKGTSEEIVESEAAKKTYFVEEDDNPR